MIFSPLNERSVRGEGAAHDGKGKAGDVYRSMNFDQIKEFSDVAATVDA
ncbi:MAG: hypothetical protein HYU78_00970 [Rhodocyclales bacterium]|nr:hypothetical protein [Rhodocyclales bacterium]